MARSQYVYIWWGCAGDSDADMLGVWTVKKAPRSVARGS